MSAERRLIRTLPPGHPIAGRVAARAAEIEAATGHDDFPPIGPPPDGDATPLGRELLAGLEAFADALAAGRLDRYRDRITTICRLPDPCPACGGIRPGEAMVSDYARSIAGHRPGCVLAAGLGDATKGGE